MLHGLYPPFRVSGVRVPFPGKKGSIFSCPKTRPKLLDAEERDKSHERPENWRAIHGALSQGLSDTPVNPVPVKGPDRMLENGKGTDERVKTTVLYRVGTIRASARGPRRGGPHLSIMMTFARINASDHGKPVIRVRGCHGQPEGISGTA